MSDPLHPVIDAIVDAWLCGDKIHASNLLRAHTIDAEQAAVKKWCQTAYLAWKHGGPSYESMRLGK